MPRLGQNPMRWVSDVHHPEKITVTTMVYIPFLEGYWAHSLDVLELCLQSLRANTQKPFDLMVLDNGSCTDVQAYLLDQYRDKAIQYFIFSEHNLGKVGAWNVLFSAAPGEIVAYADSDVYFLPVSSNGGQGVLVAVQASVRMVDIPDPDPDPEPEPVPDPDPEPSPEPEPDAGTGDLVTDGGADTAEPPPLTGDETSGCDCRVGGSEAPQHTSVLVILGLIGILLERRRLSD